MSFNKDLVSGPAGKVTVSEEAGILALEIALSQGLGGGEVKDVLKATLSGKVEIEFMKLLDAAFEIAAEKVPAAAAFIKAAKEAVDAELAKI